LLVARIKMTEQRLDDQQKAIDELREMFHLQVAAAAEISNAVNVIKGWGKWAAGIATVLISSGLLFFIGRLIYLSITGTTP
jgi:hypothetical protein